ncbi:MAG: hypothetical protein C4K48_00330 [Candidatus Thorarchaeota archaeon]|nr:MAG: hypothetical protein C4K48_00330 [Candidatus Thorarchaeota archaeon]
MERLKIGFGLGFIGVLVFLVSLFIVLPLSELYYVPSLLGMFAGVVLIALGVAVSKGVDKSMEVQRKGCYYCKGSGSVGGETCPRCGGTGITPEDE